MRDGMKNSKTWEVPMPPYRHFENLNTQLAIIKFDSH